MKKSGLADSPFFSQPPDQEPAGTPPSAPTAAKKALQKPGSPTKGSPTKGSPTKGSPTKGSPAKGSSTKDSPGNAPAPQKKEKPPRHRDTMTQRNRDTTTQRNRDTTTPRNRDTMPPRYHDTIIQLVRRAVKEIGKEAATYRFTLAEKKALDELLYTYKKRGQKTSENEITRIALNFILEDYREDEKNSVLDRVLQALNS